MVSSFLITAFTCTLEKAVDILGLGKVPSIPQSGTSSGIVSRIMAGRSDRNSGDQSTTNSRVESSPGGSGRPAAVSRHATALAGGASIVTRRGEDGQRGQHPRVLHGVPRNERRGGVKVERADRGGQLMKSKLEDRVFK
jgi:hypothetical protein